MMVDFRRSIDDQIIREARELREQLKQAAKALELFTIQLDEVTAELKNDMRDGDDDDQ